ncbi:MAG: PAS domain-containing protein [Prolixibacteraceae bacterium]
MDDSVVEIGQFITDQLRTFIKSGLVILVVHDDDIQAGWTIIGKSPHEQKLDEKISWIYQIAGLCNSLDETIFVKHNSLDSELAVLLQKFEGKTSILSPLYVGNSRIGLLLLLDVNYPEELQDLPDNLDLLSGVLALKLKGLEYRQKLDFDKEKRTYALQESEKYNRFLFDHSVTGLALCAMDGSLIDVNPAFSDIIGRSVEETLQLSYWDITPEKYKDQEEVQLSLLETEGKYGPYRKEYIHKSGQLIPVVLKGTMIELNGERFIWSTVEDISELTKIQNEVIETSRRFIDVLKNVNQISVLMDSCGQITFCNDYFLKLTGYESAEVIGNNWFEMFLPEEIASFLSEKQSTAIRENKEFDVHYENEILTKSGERRLIAWTNTFLKDFDGKITGSASLGKDITERNQANRMIRERLDELYRGCGEMKNCGIRILELKEEVKELLLKSKKTGD